MKIGLALGSGGARGITHLGVWQRLQELEIPIHCIAGTSIGAIAGATIAAGRVDEAISWCKMSSWKKLPELVLDLPTMKALIAGRKVEKKLRQISATGTDCFITDLQEGYYRVQCGAYTVRGNAERKMAELHSMGFDAIIKEYTT